MQRADEASPVAELRTLVEEATKGVSEAIEKGPSNFLFVLGTLMLAAGLIMKVDLAGYEIAEFAPAEFIAVLFFGFCLLVLGAALRVEQYRESAGIQEKIVDATVIEGRAKPETLTKSDEDEDHGGR